MRDCKLPSAPWKLNLIVYPRFELGTATAFFDDLEKKLPSLNVPAWNSELYISEIPPGAIDIVLTDPPYGMGYRSYKKKKHGPIKGDDQPYPAETLQKLIKLPRLASYFFCRWDNLWEHDERLPKPKSVIAWMKPSGSGTGSQHEHMRSYEMVLFYEGLHHAFRGGRPSDFIRARRTGNELHPTQKPVEVSREILEWYNDFETVLDPYMGHGGTGRAAKELRKHFLGFEIDEKHHAKSVWFIDRPLPLKKHVLQIEEQPVMFSNQE